MAAKASLFQISRIQIFQETLCEINNTKWKVCLL